MQCARDLDANGYLTGGLKFAKAFIASGDYFGKVFMQRQRADIGEEGVLGGSTDTSSKTFDKSGVFLQRRIERFAN